MMCGFHLINMKNLFKKIIFFVLGLVGIFLLYLAFWALEKFTIVEYQVADSQLAQIIKIETELLKRWQERGFLKENHELGSKGEGVSLLQRMLSQDEAIYPEKGITGYYGENTRTAVTNFQKMYQLPETGKVDEETAKKLNAIFFSHLCQTPSTIYPELLLKKINKVNPLPLDYIPPDLIDVSSKVKSRGVVCLRTDVLPHLIKMFDDAKIAGIDLMITSGYRNTEIQKYLFDYWIKAHGIGALDEIAKPAYSEHQLGSALDLTDISINFDLVSPKFGSGKGGKWLKKNAHLYGFVMSYPKGMKQKTGYIYEPWHWRYVGIDIAGRMYPQRGISYNEVGITKPPSYLGNNSGLNISAQSFASIMIDKEGREKILLEKNIRQHLPIASITKIMTVLLSLEKLNYNDSITITKNSLDRGGISGFYQEGTRILFIDAIRAILISSHNEVATSIAEKLGEEDFITLMNEKGHKLGLKNTKFINATGLDPILGSDNINQSSVWDVYLIMRRFSEQYPQLLSLTTQKQSDILDVNKKFIGILDNTNKILNTGNIPYTILGGKTGETSRADQNLALIVESPCGEKIFNIVLSSNNSFDDVNKLLQYIKAIHTFSCIDVI